MITDFIFAAGEKKSFDASFRYFLILSDGGTPVDVFLRSAGGGFNEQSNQVQSGFGIEAIAGEFNELEITSSVAQTLKVYIGSNKATYNRLGGSITVTNNAGVFTNTAPVITNVSSIVLAANLNRRLLQIQNNDPAGILSVNFGAPATFGNGVQILPAGGSASWERFAPTNSINIIGSIANNPNVIVTEG